MSCQTKRCYVLKCPDKGRYKSGLSHVMRPFCNLPVQAAILVPFCGALHMTQ